MANLPSNTFMFNYNAKDYNPATYTFPKTTGQLFDYDLTLNGAPYSYTDEYVNFAGKTIYMGKTYNSYSENPFRRNSSNNNFTFIYKTGSFTQSNQNLFSNRSTSAYNYMVRGNMFHTSTSGFLGFTAVTSPQIFVIRVNTNGSCERKQVDIDGNTLYIATASTISWGSETSNAVGFFSGYGDQSAENFQDVFYWMYCSLETLTDAEVLQVIQYNEGIEPPQPLLIPTHNLYINGNRIN